MQCHPGRRAAGPETRDPASRRGVRARTAEGLPRRRAATRVSPWDVEPGRTAWVPGRSRLRRSARDDTGRGRVLSRVIPGDGPQARRPGTQPRDGGRPPVALRGRSDPVEPPPGSRVVRAYGAPPGMTPAEVEPFPVSSRATGRRPGDPGPRASRRRGRAWTAEGLARRGAATRGFPWEVGPSRTAWVPGRSRLRRSARDDTGRGRALSRVIPGDGPQARRPGTQPRDGAAGHGPPQGFRTAGVRPVSLRGTSNPVEPPGSRVVRAFGAPPGMTPAEVEPFPVSSRATGRRPGDPASRPRRKARQGCRVATRSRSTVTSSAT